MFGLFTAVALTAFIAGLDQARDIFAIIGTSCIAAGIYGIGHRFQGSELSAESNTAKYVAPVTILSTITAALFLRDSTPAQIAGVLAILYNAGKFAMAKGAILGALSAGGALKSLGEVDTNVLKAAQVSGATGGITKARTTPLSITLFSVLSGLAIAKAAAEVFKGIKNPIAQAILSGAVGGMFASSTATVLDNGYASFKEQGLALFARRDS